MKNKLRSIIALSILPQLLLVRWLAHNPEIVEKYYSTGFYVAFSNFFHFLFGMIPFSIGDLIYTALIVLAIRYMYKNRKLIITNKLGFLRDCLMVLSIVYFTFYTVWGLNYYRQPVSKPLQIEETYELADLIQLTESLITKTNSIQYQITADSTKAVTIPYAINEIEELTAIAYKNLAYKHQNFTPPTSSIKTSLYSTVLSYMGYSGYLNPFTNEAQVNSKIPLFRYPFVSVHEIGHQLGYSAENETNFIAYLAATAHDDIYFKYAAYSYVLSYSLSAIKLDDEATFNTLYQKVNPGILKNYNEVNVFWANYANPLEPVFKLIFDTFLKANQQTEGIKSYSKVVGLLVNYHKKYPL